MAAAGHNAVVQIDSDPQGAEIIGPNQAILGKTPAKLDMPISDMPVTFELRLAGYKTRSKQLLVTKNMLVEVPLERAPVMTNPNPNKGSGKHGGTTGTGLMRPEDM